MDALFKACKDSSDRNPNYRLSPHMADASASPNNVLLQQPWEGKQSEEVLERIIRPWRSRLEVRPVNHSMDMSRVVAFADEWLYRPPGFFRTEPKNSFEFPHTFPMELFQPFDDVSEDTIAYLISDANPRNVWLQDFPIKTRDNMWKKGLKDENWHNLCYNESELLKSKLMPQTAKKRILFVPEINHRTALLIYMLANVREQRYIYDLFLRHRERENFLIDEVSWLDNSWYTELHLGYYQLFDGTPTTPDPKFIPPMAVPFPGSATRKVGRQCFSFHFDGDLRNRYWICRIIHFQGRSPLFHLIQHHTDLFRNLKSPRQRRCLELHLFLCCISKAFDETKRLFDEIKLELGIDPRSFSWSIPQEGAYLSRSRRWGSFEPLVQALEDDLESTQKIIEQWGEREQDRGKEKPRWTWKHEQKYRTEINEYERRIKREASNLAALCHNIKVFRETYSARLEHMREDSNFHSGENVAYFTYVTIVFLPLGFAASIFSMSAPPPGSLIANMVILSVIALVVTILLISNARFLTGVVGVFLNSLRELTRTTKESSQMKEFNSKVNDFENGKATDKIKNDSPLKAGIPWNLIFWTRYVFIEYPARRISLTCRQLLGSRPHPDEDVSSHATYTSRHNSSVESSVGATRRSEARGINTERYYVQIVAGILLMLPFLVSWTIQLLVYNLRDLAVLLLRVVKWAINKTLAFEKGPDVMTWLIQPPRPLQGLLKQVEEENTVSVGNGSSGHEGSSRQENSSISERSIVDEGARSQEEVH